MLDFLNTDLGVIGALGVLITVLSWHGGRQTKAILQEQGKILARQSDILAGQQELLRQMEANALARHGQVMDKREGGSPA